MGIYNRHAVFYDPLYAARGRDAAADVDVLLRLAAARRVEPGSVLDVACGTGIHAASFAEHAGVVVGVDLSPAMLEVARSRGSTVEFVQGDFTTLDLGRRFDLVTCLFSSIGHVQDETDLRRAIDRMSSHVGQDGLLVIETWLTPDAVDPAMAGHLVSVDLGDAKVARVSHSTVEGDAMLVEFGWAIATSAGCETEVETHRMPLFDRNTYLDAVMAAGLEPEWIDPSPGLSGRPLLLGRR